MKPPCKPFARVPLARSRTRSIAQRGGSSDTEIRRAIVFEPRLFSVPNEDKHESFSQDCFRPQTAPRPRRAGSTRASVPSKSSWQTARRSRTYRHASGSFPIASRPQPSGCPRRSPGLRSRLRVAKRLSRLQCGAHRAPSRVHSAGRDSRSSSRATRYFSIRFVRRRPCSATRFRTATSRRSLVEPSSCYSWTRSGRSSLRPRDLEFLRGVRESPKPRLGISQRRSSGLSPRGTEVSVRSSAGTVGFAARATFSSSTTGTHGPRRGGTRSTESSSAAGATTTTQRCRTTALRTWPALRGQTTGPGASRT